MKEPTLLDNIRDFITMIAWRVFLWGIRMTEEQYWKQIARDERMHEAQNSVRE